MTNMNFLVVFGLLAVSQARPENGYNYPRQEQTQQLSQSSSSSQSLSQLPQLSSGPAPQLLSLSQSQQSPLQLSMAYGVPSLPAPSISQAPLVAQAPAPQIYSAPLQPQIRLTQLQPSVSYQPQQLTLNQQQSSYAVPQISAPLPQPESNYQLPQISLQPQPQSVQLPQPQSTYGSPQPAQPQSTYGTPEPAPAPQPLPNIDVRSSFGPQSQLVVPSSVQTGSLQLPQQQALNLPSLSISQQQAPNLPSLSLPQQPAQQFNLPAPLPNLPQPLDLPAPVPIITKHIYVHVAPDEPAEPPQPLPPPPPPKKNYKIIFIKAPSLAPRQSQLVQLQAIHQQPAVEEKTLVYVLVDKPQQPQIVLPAPVPTQPSKPEVYFIKYKAQSQLSAGASGPVGPTDGPSLDLGGSGSSSSLPVVEDRSRGQGESINSGESTSSLFSGGVPGAKYGPPGYQKRSVRRP